MGELIGNYCSDYYVNLGRGGIAEIRFVRVWLLGLVVRKRNGLLEVCLQYDLICL